MSEASLSDNAKDWSATRSAKRIVYLHQHFRSPGSSGGTRSFEFGRRLAAMGYEVHVVTATSESIATLWNLNRIEGMWVHSCHVPYSNRLNFLERLRAFGKFAIWASVRARRLRPDLIYATSTPLTIFIPAWFAKLFRKTPLVFEVRDLWPEVPIEMGVLKNDILIRAANLLELLAYRHANEIIALSPGMADGVRRVIGESKPLSIIPNGCDLELFGNVGSELVTKWLAARPWLSGNKLVVYAGTFGEANAVTYLVQIAAECLELDSDIRFLLIGDGKESDKILQLAASLGVLNRTLFIEQPVSKLEMPVVFAASTLSVSLFKPIEALESNSANKFFDSLAAGRPIAINYGGWQGQILESSGAGIVLDSSNARNAAQEISALLEDTKQLKKMSTSASELAESKFNRDALFSKLAAVIDRAVQDAASPNHSSQG